MTLLEYRDTYSWKGAIGLGRQLTGLAEELPASEEQGLSMQLRQLMVELPAAVAADLMNGSQARQPIALKLLTVLELVDRIYPALDTADTQQAVQSLVERLVGPNFAESTVVASAPAQEEVEEDGDDESEEEISDQRVVQEKPVVSVMVQPTQENHVQPDSL